MMRARILSPLSRLSILLFGESLLHARFLYSSHCTALLVVWPRGFWMICVVREGKFCMLQCIYYIGHKSRLYSGRWAIT